MVVNKQDMEKKLAKYLDERYLIAVNSEPYRYSIDIAYYNGACAAITQIGGWERDDNGKHFVRLNK